MNRMCVLGALLISMLRHIDVTKKGSVVPVFIFLQELKILRFEDLIPSQDYNFAFPVFRKHAFFLSFNFIVVCNPLKFIDMRLTVSLHLPGLPRGLISFIVYGAWNSG